MPSQRASDLVKGGKYVGKGTFGCVFSPPLRCEEDASPRKGRKREKFDKHAVGKVFKDEDSFLDETSSLQRLGQVGIDPKHDFTVRLRKTCRVAPPRAVDLNGADPACKNFFQSPEGAKHMQLIMDDGGQTLKQWALQPRKNKPRAFIQLIRQLGPLLHGLMAMIDKGWVHSDIKADNVMIKKGKLALIDFGIAETRGHIFEQERDWALKHDYPTFPIEFKAYMRLFDSSGTRSVLSPAEAKADFEKNMASLSKWEDMYVIVGVNWQQQLETFSLKLASLHRPSPSQKHLQDLFREFTRSTDSYGLGMTLLQVYSFMDLTAEQTIHRSHKTQTSLILIYMFLQKLVDPNPFSRYNIYQAYQFYRFILPLL